MEKSRKLKVALVTVVWVFVAAAIYAAWRMIGWSQGESGIPSYKLLGVADISRLWDPFVILLGAILLLGGCSLMRHAGWQHGTQHDTAAIWALVMIGGSLISTLLVLFEKTGACAGLGAFFATVLTGIIATMLQMAVVGIYQVCKR